MEVSPRWRLNDFRDHKSPIVPKRLHLSRLKPEENVFKLMCVSPNPQRPSELSKEALLIVQVEPPSSLGFQHYLHLLYTLNHRAIEAEHRQLPQFY